MDQYEHAMKEAVFGKTHLLPPGFTFQDGFLFSPEFS